MRTQLLGGLALLLGAGLFLGGADVARAQSSSGYAGYGYSPAYGSGYQGTTPASYRYTGYGQGAQSGWSSPYYYYPGYGYYPNYSYYYPYYSQGYQGAYQYPQGSYPSAADPDSALPGSPLSPDEIPGEEAPAKQLTVEPAHHDRFWVSADYDLSYVKPWRISAPLVTTGSATAPAGTDQSTYHAGALGQPSTSILFGDRVDFGRFDGVRLGAGLFLDDADRMSLEWTGMVQIPKDVHFRTASDANGNPVIARPFFDALHGTEAALTDTAPLGAPNLLASSGSASIDARSQFLGTELNARYEFRPTDHLHVDALAGFRFLRLAETLTIRDNLTALEDGFTFNGSSLFAGDMLSDTDSFHTINHFYGAQLGSSVRWEGKWLYASAFGKIALGATDEEVDVNGSTTVNSAVLGNQVAGGGILALPSNIGEHRRTVIGFVPEGGVNFGVKVLPCLRLTAGYSFLYWNSVVRPGAQLEHTVNPASIPSDQFFAAPGGPLAPLFHFNDESYWVHTLTVGVDFRY